MQVSVIVPIYQVKLYLQETLQSIACQTGVSFEALLIDDGSTDGSADIAKSFVERDSRFYYIYQTNQGVSATRNFGIELAKGEYIAFCDGDDCLPAGSLKKMYQAAKKTQADIVIGKMLEVSTTEVKVYKASERLSKKKIIHSQDIDLLWTFMISGKLYKRSFLEQHKIRFVNVKYSEDAVFFMECVYQANRIIGCNCTSYYYRKRAIFELQSVTQLCNMKLWQDFVQAHCDVERKYYQYLKKNLSEIEQKEYENALYRKIIETTLNAFYRQYWGCDKTLWKDIENTFQKYFQKLDEKNRKIIRKKNADLFLNEENFSFSRSKPIVTICLSDYIFDAHVLDKLNWIIQSIYTQKLISFQIVLSESLWKHLPKQYRDMSNVIVIRKMAGIVKFSDALLLKNLPKDCQTDYTLCFYKAVMLSSEGLLRAWNQMEAHKNWNGICPSSLGKWYCNLPISRKGNFKINILVRSYCKLQEKAVLLHLNKKTIQLWRTENLLKCIDTNAMFKLNGGESGFRVIRL